MHNDLWRLVSDSLARTPAQPAWIRRLSRGRREVLRYADVEAAAVAMAARLAGQGVRPGDIVGICAPNGPEWGAAALAIWRLGAVVGPIHIGNSPSEVSAQARALAPRLVLTATDQHRFDNPVAIDVHARSSPADAPPPAGIGGEQEAVRLYTSGSMGVPKLVRLSHGNLVSNALSATRIDRINARDRFLSLLPCSHAMGLTGDLLLPLISGATVVVPRVLASNEIMSAMAQERITIVVAVPRLFRNIMEGLENRIREGGPMLRLYISTLRALPLPVKRLVNGPLHRQLGGRIKCWMSGGSRLDPEITRYFHRLGLPLRQGYGLTEASPAVTVQDAYDSVLDSIGKPLEGVEVRIHEPDAAGCGELWVRGPNVMLGYVDEAQTREVLHEGWLRTGDLARIDDAGRLILTGRAKRLIVTEAGKNVYPEEIETWLERIAGVKEAGVFELDARPAAVLAVGGEHPESHAREIVRDYNARASGHNRVVRFAVVDELPRTPLGKVALNRLREVFDAHQVPHEVPRAVAKRGTGASA